jgi:hypothetical protein
MVPGSFKPLSPDARLEGCFLFGQVQGHAVEQPEVLRRISGALRAQIRAQGHVEHPVELVFDAPVLADHIVQSLSTWLEAGDVIANPALGLASGFVVTLAFDAHQPVKRGPLGGPFDHAQVGNHRAPALLDAPMAAVDLLGHSIAVQQQKGVSELSASSP